MRTKKFNNKEMIIFLIIYKIKYQIKKMAYKNYLYIKNYHIKKLDIKELYNYCIINT